MLVLVRELAFVKFRNSQEESKANLVESEPVINPPYEQPPFQQLFVSCPDGLAVTYFPDSVTGALIAFVGIYQVFLFAFKSK